MKRLPNQRADPGMTLNDSVDYAETRWVLKVVESDISYLANENIQAVFASMDPSSEILSRMSLNSKKIINFLYCPVWTVSPHPGEINQAYKRRRRSWRFLHIGLGLIHHQTPWNSEACGSQHPILE